MKSKYSSSTLTIHQVHNLSGGCTVILATNDSDGSIVKELEKNILKDYVPQ